jgi:YVTN family beta-propeller protein
VSVFDIDRLEAVKTIAVGDHPEGIAADAEGRYVYVALWGDDELVKIDAGRLEVVGRAPVGAGPRAFGAFLR